MSFKTLFLENPKITNILIILLVSFNLLFVIGWVADSHRHHHYPHYNRGRGNFGRDGYCGRGFHHSFHGRYGGGFGEEGYGLGGRQGSHYYRGFRHRHHHHGFGNEDGYASFQGQRDGYNRDGFGGGFHKQNDSMRNTDRAWEGNYHARSDSAGHRHGFRHLKQS